MALPVKIEASPGAAALGLSDDEYKALVGAQDAEFDSDSLQVPILKIGQPLTKEVQAENAEAGEFINTLLGEGIGSEIDFIVAYYQPGRFASDKDSGRGFAAFGDLIPEHWEALPFVGPALVGTRFDEHPDAEEVYKERVNNKEIEWKSGPRISTTHNYTGLALIDGEMQPVRLSLKRTDMPAVRKINSLKKMSMRNQPFFVKVFHFTTEKKTFTKGSAYLLSPSLLRDSTQDEMLAALELAQAVAGGRVVDNLATVESEGSAPAPKAEGALDV